MIIRDRKQAYQLIPLFWGHFGIAKMMFLIFKKHLFPSVSEHG